MIFRSSMIQYLFVVAAVGILDQLTKGLVIDSLSLYEQREVISGLFNLVYVTNPGAAFSMFATIDSVWRQYFFLAVGGCAVLGISFYAWKMTAGRWHLLALALICGGALGNLIDRVRFGAVVDFLDFYFKNYHWPAFNVADSAICVGAAVYMLASFFEEKQANAEDKA